MRAFLILACAGVALARPEAGYSYSQPSAPSGSYGAPGGGGFGGGSSGGFGGGSSSGGFSSGGFSSGGFSSGGGGFGGSQGGLGGGAGGGFGGFGGSSGGGGGGGGTLIQKHIYVHVPPPEQEEPRPNRQFGPAPTAQKHYKIIFIKAPTAPTPTAPAFQPIAQDEQKTLIYVLVKKPEDAPDVTLPTAAPTQPSKPEVYFIKYKTQKEGGAGGFSGGAGGLGGLGGGLGGGHGGDAGLGGGDGGFGGSIGGGHGGSSGGAGAPSGSYGAPGASGPY